MIHMCVLVHPHWLAKLCKAQQTQRQQAGRHAVSDVHVPNHCHVKSIKYLTLWISIRCSMDNSVFIQKKEKNTIFVYTDTETLSNINIQYYKWRYKYRKTIQLKIYKIHFKKKKGILNKSDIFMTGYSLMFIDSWFCFSVSVVLIINC